MKRDGLKALDTLRVSVEPLLADPTCGLRASEIADRTRVKRLPSSTGPIAAPCDAREGLLRS